MLYENFCHKNLIAFFFQWHTWLPRLFWHCIALYIDFICEWGGLYLLTANFSWLWLKQSLGTHMNLTHVYLQANDSLAQDCSCVGLISFLQLVGMDDSANTDFELIFHWKSCRIYMKHNQGSLSTCWTIHLFALFPTLLLHQLTPISHFAWWLLVSAC